MLSSRPPATARSVPAETRPASSGTKRSLVAIRWIAAVAAIVQVAVSLVITLT